MQEHTYTEGGYTYKLIPIENNLPAIRWATFFSNAAWSRYGITPEEHNNVTSSILHTIYDEKLPAPKKLEQIALATHVLRDKVAFAIQPRMVLLACTPIFLLSKYRESDGELVFEEKMNDPNFNILVNDKLNVMAQHPDFFLPICNLKLQSTLTLYAPPKLSIEEATIMEALIQKFDLTTILERRSF
jgi:hypothetical protein